jgi:hypothetical protein
MRVCLLCAVILKINLHANGKQTIKIKQFRTDWRETEFILSVMNTVVMQRSNYCLHTTGVQQNENTVKPLSIVPG